MLGMDQKIEWLLSRIKGCQNSLRKAETLCVLPTMKNSIDETVIDLFSWSVCFHFRAQIGPYACLYEGNLIGVV